MSMVLKNLLGNEEVRILPTPPSSTLQPSPTSRNEGKRMKGKTLRYCSLCPTGSKININERLRLIRTVDNHLVSRL